MALRTITSADAAFSLAVPGLYDTPQLLRGYMADSMFETDAVETAEVVLNADGNMSAGWKPHLTPMSIYLMPDSPSSDIFENWLQSNDAGRQVLFAYGTIRLNSTQREYTLYKGVLMGTPPIPRAGRVLEGRRFGITWNRVTVAPV